MDSRAHNSSVSLLDLFGVMFVGLKLSGHVTWSWFWVLSPWAISLILLLILWVVNAVLDRR
jgi:hypothetical protein